MNEFFSFLLDALVGLSWLIYPIVLLIAMLNRSRVYWKRKGGRFWATALGTAMEGLAASLAILTVIGIGTIVRCGGWPKDKLGGDILVFFGVFAAFYIVLCCAVGSFISTLIVQWMLKGDSGSPDQSKSM